MDIIDEFDLNRLIHAGKLRTHCTKMTHDELLDEVIGIYNKYYMPEIKRLADELQAEIATRDNSCACEFPESGGEPVKECFYHETRGLTNMRVKKILGSCENSCEVAGTALFNWSLKGFGFGQIYFYTSTDGKTHCDNEYMSNEKIKEILNTLVDTCIMDDS